MVIEHLNELERDKYFEKCKSFLNPGGVIICLVPSLMRNWGVEDEIAGHILRFEPPDVHRITSKHVLELAHFKG